MMTTSRTYVLGFALSTILTLTAFGLTGYHVTGGSLFTRELLIVVLVGLAVAQLIVQLTCFLHLGKENKPRWNLITFTFAVLVVVILVAGTLWIMSHLAEQGHDTSAIW